MMADLGVEDKGGREGNFPRGQRGTEKEGREEFGTRGSDVPTGNGQGIKANKGSAWALNPTREGACAPRQGVRALILAGGLDFDVWCATVWASVVETRRRVRRSHEASNSTSRI